MEILTADKTLNDISVESHLNPFKKYIDNNNRAILSARFGDGKSYFLNEFKREHKDDYEFITLYPVNYQVAENKDVFEYIKRDILIQLFTLVDLDNSEIDENLMIWSYLNDNKMSLLGDILEVIPGLKVASNVLAKFQKNIKAFNRHKEKYKTESKTAEDYITSFDTQQGIYEFDAISQLICYLNIQLIKNNPDKKLVLIIEDLDRIDPAHIFRILNIISAHIDRVYKGYDELDTDTNNIANKFGFDNIILVCDYTNIESIFNHFYGIDTDFGGYIGKFSTTKPYYYSLKEYFTNYIIDNLDTGISQYKALSHAFATLVYEKYIAVGEKKIRLKKINTDLSVKFGITCGDTISIPNTEYEVSSIHRFSKFILLLRRFNIQNEFELLYTKELRGGSNNRVPIGLVTELFYLIGEYWFFISTYVKGYVLKYDNYNLQVPLSANNFTYYTSEIKDLNCDIGKLFIRLHSYGPESKLMVEGVLKRIINLMPAEYSNNLQSEQIKL